jgi:peroxiredoxin (alkyl hydroperoxide reductase subunit C)
MVKVGEAVHDFESGVFQNEETKKVNSPVIRGKWLVLIFYPADFTFICPTELEEAADMYGEFTALGAEITVSTDTVFVHKAWHDNCLP